MGSPKVITLRYDAVCSSCGQELPRGTKAGWDRAARAASCEPCVGTAPEPAVAEPAPRPIERGVAGASAGREGEKRRERRETKARNRYGRLSGVYLALSNEPQSSRSWANGSRGEEILGDFLDELHDEAAVFVLHDRRIPGSRANIDHLAVTRSGIFVIDAKRYKSGTVRLVDKGGWFKSDKRLYVGRRDCSKLVAGMSRQVEAVRTALSDPIIGEFGVAIRPALCFVEADWRLFARPFELDGVWIGPRKKLAKLLSAPGALDPEHVRTLAKRVGSALPPA